MASHWKSRRLAARAKKVLARHKGIPAIGAFEGSLVPKADAFIAAYDTAAKHETSWRKEMAEGRGAMAALLEEVNAYKPHVARDRPGFDLTTIGDRPAVPEDLIQDGLALADELALIVGADGAPAAWAQAAAATLREKSEAAEMETDEAADADSTHNTNLLLARDALAAFDAELQLFRATLRAKLPGKSRHPDFQKLRAEKATAGDEDDDPGAPQPSPVVAPAPPPPVL